MKQISDRKIEANRKNALKSTGPKTKFGKRMSSMNSLKHGFNANKFVVEGEKTPDFKGYFDNLLQILDPKNALEEEFAFQIILTGWKYRRYVSLESRILNQKTSEDSKKEKIYIRWLNEGETIDDVENEPTKRTENKDNLLPKEFKQIGSLFKLSVMEQRQLSSFHKLLASYWELKATNIN